ncbi:pyridoxamine 5'-phosphate oxidase family protein [Saccharopolyspora rhizosphaerae]|uniref:Pyridoxamine 5'-phosphate oxidase family protein n=1 Tax=Saccharopolyspora rhizosphaerae TaxID=2492662 RepID=A0A426JKG4_9PSEU|nr:pyridoxamine 5'-phosphate oxidase family protein [Saccharopolyspora rhizosphaerae]RRO13697.1 pyridoxamine 5'-phosphate oxidase family protein [Saccharopolyspora rhizosphaerae]
MTGWQEFTEQAPELAQTARARLESARHHVLATLRADGSPRVSGTEVGWYRGDLVLGSMPGARKARDLQRDGRFAVHANPGDGSMAEPDVKLSGTATEVTGDEQAAWVAEVGPPQDDAHLFRCALNEVVTTTVSEDETHLVITSWTPEHGVRVFKRA